MKVLFFAPHSAVWIHAFPEALVAEALAQEGNEIVYIGCGGVLRSHCISMAALAVPFEATDTEKGRVCRLCRLNRNIVRKRFGFSGIDLSDSVNAEDRHIADSLTSAVTPQDCLDLIVDGVEIGRIALYELLIQSKKTGISFSDGEWKRYQASLRNGILVLRVIQRLLSLEHPDRVVVYNSLYSVNRVVCRWAEINGVPPYFMHAGDNLSNRLQTLILALDNPFAYFKHLRHQWIEIQERPSSTDAMRSATDHFLEVARGRSVWAYSAAAGDNTDLRKKFGVEKGQKVICATLSSDDERFSGEIIGALPDSIPLFPRQVEWINALTRYVGGRDDLSLIIRVHPREFPNKREGVLSEHAKMLQVALADLPENVKVNWPTDNISLYDLANITDVFVNAWSSAGKEMAWLGLPVVLYSHDLTLYPADLNYVGTTEVEYFQKIEQALRDGWDPERIRRTYRWCAVEYKLASLDISESFSRKEHRSLFARAKSRLLRSILSSQEQEADCRNRARRLHSAARIDSILRNQMSSAFDPSLMDVTVSSSQEIEALKKQVGRLVKGLYGTTKDSRQNSLVNRLREFASS
jgi:hypothetical protein